MVRDLDVEHVYLIFPLHTGDVGDSELFFNIMNKLRVYLTQTSTPDKRGSTKVWEPKKGYLGQP